MKCVKAAAVDKGQGRTDALNPFLVPIAVGYPDALEFEADAWIFKRMMTQLDHTPRESLAFLRKMAARYFPG